MKKFLNLICLSLLLLLSSCEKVVNVDLEESAPRLVVEASLIWDRENESTPLYIKLSETTPYFEEENAPGAGAEVYVFSEEGAEYLFEEISPGLYKHDGFLPDSQVRYSLQILYNGEYYEASETIVSVPELDFVQQTDEGGFSGDDTEFRIFYTDPAGEANYYLFKFYYHEMVSLQIYDDEFTDGNQTFAFFGEEDIEPGDQVLFEVQGISRRFYDYLYLLRSQTGSSGGPFQSAPTLVKGNIVNTTNPDNFAFGYFRLSYRHSLPYQVR